MSDVIFWVLILAAFVLAFIGLIKPVIPAIPVLWVGFLIYQFGINGATLSWVFWTAMIVLTIFIFVSDLWLNRYFVNRFGGTKKRGVGRFNRCARRCVCVAAIRCDHCAIYRCYYC